MDAISANYKRKIDNLNEKDLLPLVCSAAALRKADYLRLFLLKAKSLNINKYELYESLLQNYLFTGYPSAIVSLKMLKEYFPGNDEKLSEDWDLNKYRNRGMQNCKKIYGGKFNKLISNVKEFSPELSDWLVLEGYGKVMGRKELSLKKRELNVVSVLAVLKFEDQLYSHINGAFRTRSSKEEIRRVLKNLKIFDSNEWTKFGMKVLNHYLKEKGIE